MPRVPNRPIRRTVSTLRWLWDRGPRRWTVPPRLIVEWRRRRTRLRVELDRNDADAWLIRIRLRILNYLVARYEERAERRWRTAVRSRPRERIEPLPIAGVDGEPPEYPPRSVDEIRSLLESIRRALASDDDHVNGANGVNGHLA